MKETRLLMGMPITVEIIDNCKKVDIEKIYRYFEHIDKTFSTYKPTSEISRINNNELKLEKTSLEMRLVFELCEKTKKETGGYFDIFHGGKYDSSGLVKGWAVQNASNLLKERGFKNFYIEAGGDIQVSGKNQQGQLWSIGIRNPFEISKIVKVLKIDNCGVATSGTYFRGQHIYNPKNPFLKLTDIASLTVIGPNVYHADRYATAAFAMGKDGINFIEKLQGFEGYMIDNKGMATFTTGFEKYL